MTLTLEITPDLEEALRETAQREGIPPDRYVLKLLKHQLKRDPTHAPPLPHEEAELLRKINEGLPETRWEYYHALKAKRDANTLTEEEHAELLGLVNEIEVWNARRLQFVGELARLRGVSLRDLVHKLGLGSPSHA
jgi:hypothetical protein